MSTRKSDLEQLIENIHGPGLNCKGREIYIHGAYGGSQEEDGEPGVEYRMATTFVKNLHILDSLGASNILVHMHTIGGSWPDGLAMYDAIKASKSPITILAYAQASSMSSILIQAADRRVLMPKTAFMVHHGEIGIIDNAIPAISSLECIKRECKAMLQIYSERCIKGEYFVDREYSRAKVESYIDRKCRDKGDWHLSAEEAVHYGFADSVFDYRKGYDAIRVNRKVKLNNDE